VATLYEVDGMVSKTESIYRRQIDSWRDRAGADGSTISRFVGYWRRASASADGSARASRRKD
jgi:hypothetical protein